MVKMAEEVQKQLKERMDMDAALECAVRQTNR